MLRVQLGGKNKADPNWLQRADRICLKANLKVLRVQFGGKDET